jgi:hypothetical protein
MRLVLASLLCLIAALWAGDAPTVITVPESRLAPNLVVVEIGTDGAPTAAGREVIDRFTAGGWRASSVRVLTARGQLPARILVQGFRNAGVASNGPVAGWTTVALGADGVPTQAGLAALTTFGTDGYRAMACGLVARPDGDVLIVFGNKSPNAAQVESAIEVIALGPAGLDEAKQVELENRIKSAGWRLAALEPLDAAGSRILAVLSRTVPKAQPPRSAPTAPATAAVAAPPAH